MLQTIHDSARRLLRDENMQMLNSIDGIVSFVCSRLTYVYWILFGLCLVSKFHVVWVATYAGLFASTQLYSFLEAYKQPACSTWNPIDGSDIALITGGASGLGKEVARTLVSKTGIAKVIVLDVRPCRSENDKIEYHVCDIGNETELKHTIRAIVDDLRAKGQRISVVINNAAVRHHQSLLNLPDDQIRAIFDVNTFSQIWILKAIISNHIERVLPETPNARLSIVSVSSVLGILGPKNLSVYSASKAAITQIHESLTQELAEYPSIRLLLVTTGQLTTDMFSDVSPSKLFLAPLVSHSKLGEQIVDSINKGIRGVICEPLYANFLPIVKVLPIYFQDWCRRFSKMDSKVIDQTDDDRRSIKH